MQILDSISFWLSYHYRRERVNDVSLYFSGGVPIQYFGLDPIDPRSSWSLKVFPFYERQNFPPEFNDTIT